MPNATVTVPVQMDAKTFRRFAVFDALRRQKRWMGPAVFTGILLVSAALCYSQTGVRPGAVLLSSVLVVLALGLPAVYFGMFFHSLTAQVKKLGLGTPKPVYRLSLTDAADGVEVSADAQTVRYQWGTLFGVWRMNDAIYLYTQPGRAFILPLGQIRPDADALWALCQAKLGADKLHDLKK